MTEAVSLKRKLVRSTNAQIEYLVDFMSANKRFAAGEFSGPLGGQQIEAEWARLSDSLAQIGPRKTIEQWKHTWRDLKKKAREEGGRIRVARNQTGNNTVIPKITDKTKKILDTIGHQCATGIEVEEESGIGDLASFADFIPPPPEYQMEVEVEVASTSRQPTGQSPEEGQESFASSSTAKRRRGDQHVTSNAEQFIIAQKQTNKILEEVQKELQLSNEVRREELLVRKEELSVLHKISEIMEFWRSREH